MQINDDRNNDIYVDYQPARKRAKIREAPESEQEKKAEYDFMLQNAANLLQEYRGRIRKRSVPFSEIPFSVRSSAFDPIEFLSRSIYPLYPNKKADWHTNRYVKPFDYNRTTHSRFKSIYLSASDIVAAGQKYIATDAPRLDSIQNFWEIIINKNCQTIVTLVMPIENGKDRCLEYWNNSFLPLKLLKSGWIVLKVAADHFIYGYDEGESLRFREFFLEGPRGQKRSVYQLHHQNWKDGSTPDMTVFERLIDEIDATNGNKIDPMQAKKRPILVHCAGGIGRTGTTIATHSLRTMIQAKLDEGASPEDIDVNIPQTILDLRQRRPRMVQNSDQMNVIYNYLHRYFKAISESKKGPGVQ